VFVAFLSNSSDKGGGRVVSKIFGQFWVELGKRRGLESGSFEPKAVHQPCRKKS